MKLFLRRTIQKIQNLPFSFKLIVLLVFTVMVFVAYHVGTGGDDILYGNNGRYALKYFFLPKGTVYTECVDGKPVCAVMKRKNKYDSHGIKAIREGKIDEGMELLEKAYQYNSNNFGIWFWMGYEYYYQKKFDKAIVFFQKYMGFWPGKSQADQAMIMAGRSFIEFKY